MQPNTGITENFSEKRRRGRPKSRVRTVLEECGGENFLEGCDRTKLNTTYESVLYVAVMDSDEDTRRLIWGNTQADRRHADGGGSPKGWKTLAVEAGRCIESTGLEVEDMLVKVADLRRQGLSFKEIYGRLRRWRLGERTGDTGALFMRLARTLADYIARFPATTYEQHIEAIQDLYELIESFRPEPMTDRRPEK